MVKTRKNKEVDDISLDNMSTIRSYLYSLGIEIDDENSPKYIPYPTKAIPYSRRYAITYSENEITENERKSTNHSIRKLKGLYKKLDKPDCKAYIESFIQSVDNAGSRIAEKKKIAEKRIQELYDDRKTVGGKLKSGADVVFRLGGSAGVYEFFEDGPFRDSVINIGGVEVNVSDLSLISFAGALGMFTYISHKWTKYKEDAIWDELRKDKERIYKQVTLETIEEFERYFPDAINRFEPKDEKEILEKSKTIKRRYRKIIKDKKHNIIVDKKS